jgi:hypothetical protein
MYSYEPRTTTPVSPQRIFPRTMRIPSLRRLNEGLARSTDSSEYLTRFRLFEERKQEIDNLILVGSDWNSYSSPSPSLEAMDAAKHILDKLQGISLLPTRVLPSAEGGVAMVFLSSGINRAVAEALNNGETFVLLYDLNGNNQTIDWGTSTSENSSTLDKLQKHLRGSGLASS